MLGAFFLRTSVLMSLLHAKKLLVTHGYQSFYDYIVNFFDPKPSKHKKGPNAFMLKIKGTVEYKEFRDVLEELQTASNHPKLRKLVEILVEFFNDPQHTENSKVIVFSQFRASATEIKKYLDLKAPGIVKS